MNLNWNRTHRLVPRLEITGSTSDQHGKIKNFYPPEGVDLIARMEKTEKGVDKLVVTFAQEPTAEQLGEVNPNQLSDAELVVHAA